MNPLATACGKIILLGEHAVVYGQPAIAIPVTTLRAQASLIPGPDACFLSAKDIGLEASLDALSAHQPLAFCIRLASDRLHIQVPHGTITLSSQIPVASGLGSGAAVSTALVRLLAVIAGRAIAPADTSAIVWEVERLYHGTPSGVDNTVIAWELPIWFVAGKKPHPLRVADPVRLLIADSGIPGETKVAVGGLRQRWQEDPLRYQSLFDKIGALALAGRTALENGDMKTLGMAMTEDHGCLAQMGVSLPVLDRLVDSALSAGAWGAKLSGGGLGGHIIALIRPKDEIEIAHALRDAGATSVYATSLDST
jgi:mevalonate kinase